MELIGRIKDNGGKRNVVITNFETGEIIEDRTSCLGC